MPRVRAKVSHPTFQKLEKLCALACELGLQILFDGDRTIVHDVNTGEEWDWSVYYGAQTNYDWDQPIDVLPCDVNWKLTKDTE